MQSAFTIVNGTSDREVSVSARHFEPGCAASESAVQHGLVRGLVGTEEGARPGRLACDQARP